MKFTYLLYCYNPVYLWCTYKRQRSCSIVARLIMFTQIYPHFTPFTHVYYSLSTFYPVSSCLPQFIHILPRLLMFTVVYPCFTRFNLVYPSLSMFYPVYPCVPKFIHILPRLPMFTQVYQHFTPFALFTPV